MNGIPAPSEILGAMITPAVLISASGVLVLSTSHRVGRTVDRVRVLATEVERLQTSAERGPPLMQSKEFKRKHIGDQLMQLSERALLLRSALTALYTAIGLLVTTSILVGAVALLVGVYLVTGGLRVRWVLCLTLREPITSSGGSSRSPLDPARSITRAASSYQQRRARD